MAKLILSLEGSVIREIPIDKERLTIGRKATNDIQIENLAVSGEHACIVTILADSFLEDLGSTNGTLVNGNQIKKHILQNNDVIEIGKYKMKYVIEATASQAPAEDFERTMVLRAPPKAPAAPKPAAAPAPAAAAPKAAAPAAAPAPAAPKPAAPAPAAAPPAPAAPKPAAPAPAPAPAAALPAAPVPAAPKPAAPAPSPAPAPAAAPAAASSPAAAPTLAALLILTGGNAGKEIDLTKNLTTLGKTGQVSVITRRPQGYFITHVEGANFPVVNGKALDAQARQLNDHDVIELAGVKMEFFLRK
jgi:pSer/pThr/pTyr-binding forkhead associated (FHA) protein